MNSVKILVPSGSMGVGVSEAAFSSGLNEGPDVIATDAGSTDSGPHYLGTGKAKCSVAVLKAELRTLMIARAEKGIPLIVGSCGTCGSDAGVDLMRELCEEIASELGQTVRVACIYSEQDASTLIAALRAGRISPLQPVLPVDEALLLRCSHVVAVMGVEPIIHALEEGADIVLAGRATDTAVMAAVPIMKGAAQGAAWHAGKILECGAMCTTHPASRAVLATIDESGFTVSALGPDAKATPRSVMAHMLYENSNPDVLIEPGGSLNVSDATYTVVDDRRVRVEGSMWTPAERYTVKLEGAAPAGYQAVSVCIIRDPEYLARFGEWLAGLDSSVRAEIGKRLGLTVSDYHLEFRSIGKDATLGALESKIGIPVEICVMAIVTSPSARTTREIISVLSPPMLHFTLPDAERVATHAFPLSPASMDRGLVYEFVLNHVLTVEDPLAPFRFSFKTIGVTA
ncbi:acyclic terpene utilization AtuA family protein [Paraburkholderia heleia]|uniref:acyclic terpene utilization AtuA family protein n=1 Tax=Paraburkholderia heleia TaxID=634127 RepID=UPI0031E301AD